MTPVYHVPTRAHVRQCPECQKRMEFLDRLQTEVIVVGEELGLAPRYAIPMLVTLACTMADTNHCLEDLLEHMNFSIDMVADRLDALEGD